MKHLVAYTIGLTVLIGGSLYFGVASQPYGIYPMNLPAESAQLSEIRRAAETYALTFRHQEAYAAYQQAQAIQELDELSLNSMAQVEMALGKYDQAIDNLRKSEDKYHSEVTYHLLAVCSFELGRFADARRYLDLSLDAKPTDAAYAFAVRLDEHEGDSFRATQHLLLQHFFGMSRSLRIASVVLSWTLLFFVAALIYRIDARKGPAI